MPSGYRGEIPTAAGKPLHPLSGDDVKRTPLAPVLALEVRSHHLLGCRSRRSVEIDDLERRACEDGLDLLEVPGVVGDDLETSSVAHSLGQVLDVLGANETAFVMPRLGPRIGEVDMDGAQGVVCEVVSNQGRGIGENDTGVVALVPSKSVGGVAPIPPGVLDAQKVDVRPRSGLRDQESAFSRAHLELQGGVVAENRPGRDRPGQLFLGESKALQNDHPTSSHSTARHRA